MTSTTNNNTIEGASRFENAGELVNAMEREDEVVGEGDDEVMFVSVSKNNITAQTRKGYHDSNKRLVIWLYHKDSDTLNEDVVSTINLLCRSVFVDEKAKNKAMNKTALKIVEKASADFHPITFRLLTVKIFMMFLFEMGRKNKVSIGSILGRSGITKY